MNLQEQSARGAKAAALLNDPLLQESFEMLRQAILSGIEDAPIRDQEGVHELKLMLKLLKDLRGNLESVIRDGQIASLNIDRANGAKGRN